MPQLSAASEEVPGTGLVHPDDTAQDGPQEVVGHIKKHHHCLSTNFSLQSFRFDFGTPNVDLFDVTYFIKNL